MDILDLKLIDAQVDADSNLRLSITYKFSNGTGDVYIASVPSVIVPLKYAIGNMDFQGGVNQSAVRMHLPNPWLNCEKASEIWNPTNNRVEEISEPSFLTLTKMPEDTNDD